MQMIENQLSREKEVYLCLSLAKGATRCRKYRPDTRDARHNIIHHLGCRVRYLR